MEETTILFRPVGQQELDLIRDSKFAEFPPRLPHQPIFYPVLTEEYATQIALDWNAKSNEDKVGYVTRFHIRSEYPTRYEVQTVGGSIHQEYWIHVLAEGKDRAPGITSFTRNDGAYSFSQLMPGRYLLVVNRKDFQNSQSPVARILPTLLYPGVNDIGAATVIVVEKDQKPQAYDFVLPIQQ